MVLVILLAVGIGLGLIVILRGEAPVVPYKSSSAKAIMRLGERPEGAHLTNDSQADEENSAENLKRFSQFPLEDLQVFCHKLIHHFGLTYQHQEQFSENEFYILTTYDKPLVRGNIIICGHLAHRSPVINSDEIIGFSDMIKAERAMKGVFLTNGLFSEEVMKLNEGASIELIDVNQLCHLMKEVAPELLPPPSTHPDLKLVDDA